MTEHEDDLLAAARRVLQGIDGLREVERMVLGENAIDRLRLAITRAEPSETPRYVVAERIIKVIAENFPDALNDDGFMIGTVLHQHDLADDYLRIVKYDQGDAFSVGANR